MMLISLYDLLLVLLILSGGLCLFLLGACVIYARWHYGSMEKCLGEGRVLKPYFVGGSDPFFYKSVCCEEDTKRVRRFGRVFGMYEGRAPQIFIADPELIKAIFIKDFEHFSSKRVLDYGHPLINEMLDVLPYAKWKFVRAQLSPQLTTGKLRGMSGQMLDAIGSWVEGLKVKMETEEGYKFSPKRAFTALTTDVIARCAFGTRINTIDDPNNAFLKAVRKLAWDDGDSNILFTGTFTLPFMSSLEPFIPAEVLAYFESLLRDILAVRREQDKKASAANDFVDVMNGMLASVSSDPSYKDLEITETTVLSQAMFFLLAGFETTSTTLSLMSFFLSKHPSVQDELLAEVDAYLGRHSGIISHETVNELSFTRAVMMETLRLHPPLIRLERVCQRDWRHEESGLEIKEGMTVQVPIFAVHSDPEYFPDPETFQPSRWLEDKDSLNPYAVLGFGVGPHNCIGARFAKEEVSLTMASILREWKFEEVPGSKLEIKKGRLFINNYEGFQVNLVKREV